MSPRVGEAVKPSPVAPQRSPLRGYGRVLAVLATVLIGGAVLAAFSGEARHQLALSFSKQPTRYAELYFSGSPPTLVTQGGPAAVSAGLGESAAMKVSFSVANHDGETSAFPYEVEVVDAAKTILGRTSGSVTAGKGTAQTTTVTVDLSAAEQWAAVEVRLTGRDERIRMLRGE